MAAAILLGCESIGAPDAYRTQVCAVTRDLSGPFAAAVTALETAATAHDRPGMVAALDSMEPIVTRATAQLVDVPLWISGIDVVTDLRTLITAYAGAIGNLRQAIATADQTQVDAAMAGFVTARQTSPGLGEHMRTARLAGLNC